MKKLMLYLLIFIFSMSLVYAIPASWYGYVTLDSSTASDGVIVDAYISNSIGGTTTVGAVQSSGYYLIHVEGNVDDSVSFKIYGNNVTQAAQTWAAGFQHPAFNLTATSTANGQACPTYSGYTSGTSVANLGCAGEYCVHSICRAASTYCGDGYCDTGESTSSCSADCGTATGGGGGGGRSCSEAWSCTYWTGCSKEGIQKRICTDANNCGTTTNKPIEEQTCTYIEPEEPVVEEEKEEEPLVEKEPALVDIGLIEPDRKYDYTLSEGDIIKLSYKDTSYEVNLDKIDDASVEITIPSISASFTLGLGESKRIGINNDGQLDVMFILDAITDGNAELSVVLIEEAPKIEQPEPVEEPQIVPLQIMWSLILVIILILIFSYLYGRRNRYKRYL